MSDNLTLYNALRTVPQTAKKEIQAGKLKGFTAAGRNRKRVNALGIGCGGNARLQDLLTELVQRGSRVVPFV